MVIASFLITFREALEASLVIAIIITYLIKINRSDLKKYVWTGAGLGILCSFVLGYTVLIVFGSLEGVTENIFEGVASLFATIILTTMIFWMAKNTKNIKEHLHKKIDEIVSKKYVIGIASLAFIAIFKEGVETILFLTALYGIDFSGTLIGTFSGLIVVFFLAYLLMKGTVKLPLQKFFKYTSAILIVFAAGLFGFGVHELMEAAESSGYNWGFLGEHAYNINPVEESNLLHENGVIGSIAKSLVGYDGNPEVLRVLAYLLYWLVIGGFFWKTYKKPKVELPA